MIGAPLEHVPTPSVLVDLDVLESNIAGMAGIARRAGVALRPHAKTHKCPEIARLQVAAGARGLCVAKVGEAEVFAAAGCHDLFVAYPVVGEDKACRLLRLRDRVRVACGVDSVEGARTLAPPFRAARRELEVWLEIDLGFARVGVRPEQALAAASRIAEVPGLRLTGVFTHAGHAYGETSSAEVDGVGRSEGVGLATIATTLRQAGLPIEHVSVGSTPTASSAMRQPGVTECRPGNYVFHDASQVSLGTCPLEACSLTVLATVVSVPEPGRAVLDAGSKTLSSDALRPRPGGFGWILGRRSRLEWLSEEHGVIAVTAGERFRVGERVQVVPNHACVVANLHDRLVGVSRGRVEAILSVAARGRVR